MNMANWPPSTGHLGIPMSLNVLKLPKSMQQQLLVNKQLFTQFGSGPQHCPISMGSFHHDGWLACTCSYDGPRQLYIHQKLHQNSCVHTKWQAAVFAKDFSMIFEEVQPETTTLSMFWPKHFGWWLGTPQFLDITYLWTSPDQNMSNILPLLAYFTLTCLTIPQLRASLDNFQHVGNQKKVHSWQCRWFLVYVTDGA